MLYDDRFFAEPSRENLDKLISEIDKCQVEGFISYKDAEDIISFRLAYYRMMKRENGEDV